LSEARVVIDGVTVSLSNFEADNDFHIFGGFVNQALSGVITATIDFRQSTGGTALIRRARLELWRLN
jgi:hypothetical protein